MNIRKPHNFISYKKHTDKFFDLDTHEEFPHSEINEHPRWLKKKYDENENVIYRENSDGYWAKYEYDEAGNQIYYENSYGVIINYII